MSTSSLFGSVSSAGVSRTVCAVSQVVVVKLSVFCMPVAGSVSAVATVASALVTVTVTVPVGCDASFTV